MRVEPNGTVTGTFSVFRDDFVRAMLRDIPTMVTLSGAPLRAAAVAQMERYLTLSSNGRPLPLVVDSTDSDGAVYFFRFRSTLPGAGGWSFSNTMLFREYSDQMNLLRFEREGSARSYVLNTSRQSIDLLSE